MTTTRKDTTQHTLVRMGLVSSFSINETVGPPVPITRPTSALPLKIKMESIGVPPTHDDDWDQCPARTRPIWPQKLVPWWKPSLPSDKPPYTYATLVAFAILTSTDGRLLLSDIYRWISQTYPYYVLGRGGWQNSIRHNLSLNKQWFVKVDRRPTLANPGKGCYWTLVAGSEPDFIETITHQDLIVGTFTTTTMKITRPEDYGPPLKKATLMPMYTTFRMTTGNPKRKRTSNKIKIKKKRRTDERWECDSGVGGFNNHDKNKTVPVEYNVLDHFLDQLPPYDLNSILGTLDDDHRGFFFTDCLDDPLQPMDSMPAWSPKQLDGPLVIHLNGDDDMADQYLTFDEDDNVSLGKKLLDTTYF